MTVKTNNSIKDICPSYRSPEIKVIEVKVQSVLCGSTERLQEDEFNWNE